MPASVPLNETYACLENSQTLLSVTVGEGQTGTITVSLDNVVIKNAQDQIKDLSLGTGKSLDGKSLVISTPVIHADGNSTNASMKYTLAGGKLGSKDFLNTDQFDAATNVRRFEDSFTFSL